MYCSRAAASLGAADASDAAGETFRDWEQLLAERLQAEHVEPETALAPPPRSGPAWTEQ